MIMYLVACVHDTKLQALLWVCIPSDMVVMFAHSLTTQCLSHKVKEMHTKWSSHWRGRYAVMVSKLCLFSANHDFWQPNHSYGYFPIDLLHSFNNTSDKCPIFYFLYIWQITMFSLMSASQWQHFQWKLLVIKNTLILLISLSVFIQR